MKERRIYTKEYKIMIVSLVNSGQTPVEVAKEYGLRPEIIRRWRRESSLGGDRPIFTGNGVASMTDDEKKLLNLQKELEEVKIERDILKKVVGIFSAKG